MRVECWPITVLPHTTRLFRDYLAADYSGLQQGEDDSLLRRCYPTAPFEVSHDGGAWMRSRAGAAQATPDERARLADLLLEQNRTWGAGAAALANIEKLRSGAAAVVTGQQVGLFGGPLLTLLKAATAIRKAREATKAGEAIGAGAANGAREANGAGLAHVPIFWLATEDHDLAEVDHVSLPAKHHLETLRIALSGGARPVGGLLLDDGVTEAIAQMKELLGHAPVCELLEEAYAPGATLGNAFARFISKVFADQGLVVIDAASREFHALGASTLRYAMEHADNLHLALLGRNAELEAAGYQAQVMVPEGGSLLFLLDAKTGARTALKKVNGQQEWKAGGQSYSRSELIGILEAEPERISPNALLRAVFQDTILPTSAYVGGPAEIAYFAQSQVVYQQILGRTTPVLPRLSATLIEPSLAKVMAQHELSLPDVMTSAEELAKRLGARAMPIESKRKLAATGNALDQELNALTEWMQSMDASLGQSAEVAANKMRYQMNRLRLMAANYELQREGSLRKHAEALTLQLFPEQTPQERVLGGVWFLARYGDGLAELLVEHAEQECPGHRAFYL